MKVIDLENKYIGAFFCCLEEYSEDMRDAGDSKRRWFEKMSEKGLRVKLALDDDENLGGMIQYLPIECSIADGEGLYFILCIWVHGHTKGRGNFQKKGMGKALLESAENDARQLGAKGIAAWGVSFPFWMKASWFKKRGYQKVDKKGMQVLLWKPFLDLAIPPRWFRQKKEIPLNPGRVTVSAFNSGWCQSLNITYERVMRAVSEFGDKVVLKEYETSDRAIQEEWGISDAIFLDRKIISWGPPMSYEKILNKISKKVKKL